MEEESREGGDGGGGECAGEGRREVKGQDITVNGEVEGVMRRGTGVRGMRMEVAWNVR